MKKNLRYILLAIFFVAAVSFVVVKYTNKKENESKVTYTLIPRAGNSSSAEWMAAKKKYRQPD
ncbi:MAG: hypothetical protein ABIO05_03140 [Ferruginibacter sp.]